MILAFMLLYIPITYVFMPDSFHDSHILILVFGIILMYPVHKLFHYLPFAHLGSKVKKILSFKYGLYPIIHVRVQEPISKKFFLFGLFMPSIMITGLLFFGGFLFPQYIHYLTILLAFHIGMSVPDFICGFNIISAPKNAYIEENEDGFQILIMTRS
jgi:hypothetical protein